MKLNNSSYGHVRVRKLCKILEDSTEMTLVTNLDEEFEEIRFVGKFGYIIIDYKKEACFTLGIHVNCLEWEYIREIMIYLNFFEIGRVYEERRRRNYNEK